MSKPVDQSRMDRIVSLAKRRGFIFQSSEIYGGLNGFWDYGPLGVSLKRNLKECWWQDMVAGHDELMALNGAPSAYEMTGLDCTIIMHPQVWKCSGHFDLFHDWMVDYVNRNVGFVTTIFKEGGLPIETRKPLLRLMYLAMMQSPILWVGLRSFLNCGRSRSERLSGQGV